MFIDMYMYEHINKYFCISYFYAYAHTYIYTYIQTDRFIYTHKYVCISLISLAKDNCRSNSSVDRSYLHIYININIHMQY
jgi:hypothetical protein